MAEQPVPPALCMGRQLSLHQPIPPPLCHLSDCPTKAKVLNPPVQEQLQVGSCRELSPPAWLMLLPLCFSFKFCCVQHDRRKITSQESGKKNRCSDSSYRTTGQELDGIAKPLVLFSLQLPAAVGTPHANTALRRCLITASRVPGMQMEGGPWDSRVLRGESLVHERRPSSSQHHHHIPCWRRKVEPPRSSAGQGRRPWA